MFVAVGYCYTTSVWPQESSTSQIIRGIRKMIYILNTNMNIKEKKRQYINAESHSKVLIWFDIKFILPAMWNFILLPSLMMSWGCVMLEVSVWMSLTEGCFTSRQRCRSGKFHTSQHCRCMKAHASSCHLHLWFFILWKTKEEILQSVQREDRAIKFNVKHSYQPVLCL